MAIYEFKCSDCGQVFEFLTSTSEKAAKNCPTCGSQKLEKLLSSFAVNTSGSSSSKSDRCDSCPTGNCPYASGKFN